MLVALALAALAAQDSPEEEASAARFAAPAFEPGRQDLPPEVARVELRAHRAAVARQKQSDTWWRTWEEADAPPLPPGLDALEIVGHLLGPERLTVAPAADAIASHVARDRFGEDGWRFEEWRSSYRVAGLSRPEGKLGEGLHVDQALFWVKRVHNERGTWTAATDVLVSFDEDGRLQHVYTHQVTDGFVTERSLTLLRTDGALSGYTGVELQHDPDGDWTRAARLTASTSP